MATVTDDLAPWVALLHRATVLRLARLSGQAVMGCGQGARACQLRGKWARRLRELDVVFGWTRKICPEPNATFLAELDVALAAAGAACRMATNDIVAQDAVEVRTRGMAWPVFQFLGR